MATPTRPFGPYVVPAVGQGTWNLERERDRAGVIASLRAGLDAGLTHVDTAELYGDGQVEHLVAEAIAGRRDQVFLVSKVLPENASLHGTIAACERSLKRLRTDRLDSYLLHWRGRHPLAETVAAMEALQAAGKIRCWGVSNFDADDIEEVVALAGPGRVACNQVLYHLEERAIEHAVVPLCRDHGIAVVAYSPFACGALKALGKSPVLARVAREAAATPAQVALAFLLRLPEVAVIPKAAKVQHVRDNAAAASLTLSPEQLAALEQAFPLGAEPTGLPTL